MSIRIASLRTLCINQRFGLTLGFALTAFACSDGDDSGPNEQTAGTAGNAVGNLGGSSASGGLSPTSGGMSAGGTPGMGGLPGPGGTGAGGRPGTGGTGTGGIIGNGGLGTGGMLLPIGGTGTGGLGMGGLGMGGLGMGGLGMGGIGIGGEGPSGGTTTGGTGTGGEGPSGGVQIGGAPEGGVGAGGSSGSGNESGGGSESGGSSAGEGQGGGDAGAGTGGSVEDGRSAGCDTEPGIPSDQYNNGQPISIEAAGMQRRYILSVPDNYDNSHAYKLVIAWHQLDGNDLQMYRDNYWGLKPLSDNSTIFVAPNGQKGGAPCSGMDPSRDDGCGWPNSNGEDLALGDAVVEEIKANFCVDTNRIFASGWSYGGSMSFANACDRPLSDSGYVRAIAVYAGQTMSGNCTPSKPVAYYGSHGTGDNVLCYDENSSSTGCMVNINGGGVGMAQLYADANGCTGWSTPQKANNGHVCTDVTGCPDGYPVKFCSFTGGHTGYPDGGWQAPLVWEFFSQF